MIKADRAKVSWDPGKKRWTVRIQIGEEVIKRPCQKASQGIGEDALRLMAVETAKDDGYDLDPASVNIMK